MSTVKAGDSGVLIAHGDATSGYSLYVENGYLVHDLNIGGEHQIVRSDRPVPPGDRVLGLHMTQGAQPMRQRAPADRRRAVRRARLQVRLLHADLVVRPRHRLRPRQSVSHYAAPFTFTGTLRKVVITMNPDQALDGDAVARSEMARQ